MRPPCSFPAVRNTSIAGGTDRGAHPPHRSCPCWACGAYLYVASCRDVRRGQTQALDVGAAPVRACAARSPALSTRPAASLHYSQPGQALRWCCIAITLTIPLIWLKTVRWQIILRAQGVRYGGWSAFPCLLRQPLHRLSNAGSSGRVCQGLPRAARVRRALAARLFQRARRPPLRPIRPAISGCAGDSQSLPWQTPPPSSPLPCWPPSSSYRCCSSSTRRSSDSSRNWRAAGAAWVRCSSARMVG